MTKKRRIVLICLATLVAILGVYYVSISLRQAAQPPKPARTPVLNESPERLYGLIEPLGREVFVGPLQSRRVVEVAVSEGSKVAVGDVISRLDADIEEQAVRVAKSRLDEAIGRLAITLDEMNRKKNLFQFKAVPELEVTQLELRAKFEQKQIETARAEVAARQTELEKFTLRAPIDGRVYKLDIRLGEQLTPQDNERIVVGRNEQQVRLYVETFWLDRVKKGQRYRVRDSETLRELGEGEVIEVSPYVGARGFRTEDRLERIDTKYAQAILKLDSDNSLPLGLQVLCERLQKNAPGETAVK